MVIFRRNDVLEKFETELIELRRLGSRWILDSNVVEDCISTVFQDQSDNLSSLPESSRGQKMFNFCLHILEVSFYKVWKFCRTCLFLTCIVLKVILGLILVYAIASSHNPTQKFVMRHSQSLIYPLLRTVRIWSLPLLRKYDYFTEWHEEKCLLKNPFYKEPPPDCWVCEDVRTVVDLTGLHNYSKAYAYNGKPFVVRDIMDSPVSLHVLKNVYLASKEELIKGTAKFVSNSPRIGSLKELFEGLSTDNELSRKDIQIYWKMNRVSSARIIRRVFKRPYFIPESSEVALQRYLYVDGPEAPQYVLPLTDFANVWLAQGKGFRLIVLDPAEGCKENCSSVSVLLKPKDVLYYNWQVWRPRSLPARLTDDLSIAFMGSFY
ncbi:uncharacterized protein LOC143225119 [Tachypleus tridentatus]|uniref:uncharacterized protein LOC143225119 n=1 Tax=Tachypleus tridentatus TaxID=6853 RepID=UPI003FD09655